MKILKSVFFIAVLLFVAVAGFKVVNTQTALASTPSYLGPPVTDNTPNITLITPGQGTANTVVSVYGTNLAGATEVDFYNSSYQLVGSINNSVQNNITVSSAGSPLQFALTGAFAYNVTGALQVRVVTPAGTSNVWPFTITAPSANAPTITGITPSQGTANTNVTIYGTNFTGATEIDFYNANNQWAGSISNSTQANFTVLSGGSSLQFIFPATLAYNFDPGTYQVKVVTSAGPSNSQSFTVTAPASNAPTLSSLSPTSVAPGATVFAYGTNFNQSNNGTRVYIDVNKDANGNGVPAYIVVPSIASGGTSLSFVLPSNLAAGTHSVQVAVLDTDFPYTNPAWLTVAVPAPITQPGIVPPVTTIPPPVNIHNNNDASTQIIRQQLAQLISLLLQLLQQASAQGLLTPGQMSSVLNSISQ